MSVIWGLEFRDPPATRSQGQRKPLLFPTPDPNRNMSIHASFTQCPKQLTSGCCTAALTIPPARSNRRCAQYTRLTAPIVGVLESNSKGTTRAQPTNLRLEQSLERRVILVGTGLGIALCAIRQDAAQAEEEPKPTTQTSPLGVKYQVIKPGNGAEAQVLHTRIFFMSVYQHEDASFGPGHPHHVIALT